MGGGVSGGLQDDLKDMWILDVDRGVWNEVSNLILPGLRVPVSGPTRHYKNDQVTINLFLIFFLSLPSEINYNAYH